MSRKKAARHQSRRNQAQDRARNRDQRALQEQHRQAQAARRQQADGPTAGLVIANGRTTTDPPPDVLRTAQRRRPKPRARTTGQTAAAGMASGQARRQRTADRDALIQLAHRQGWPHARTAAALGLSTRQTARIATRTQT